VDGLKRNSSNKLRAFRYNLMAFPYWPRVVYVVTPSFLWIGQKVRHKFCLCSTASAGEELILKLPTNPAA
jgi:hypothetical protein